MKKIYYFYRAVKMFLSLFWVVFYDGEIELSNGKTITRKVRVGIKPAWQVAKQIWLEG